MQLLTPEDLRIFIDLLRQNKGELSPGPLLNCPVGVYERIEATRDYLSRIEFATPEEIESARQTYCWDDDAGIHVDDDARVSRCADGDCWIGAWVLIGGKGPGE